MGVKLNAKKRGFRDEYKETSADSCSAFQAFCGFCGYVGDLVLRADVGVCGSTIYFGEAE